MCGHDDPEGKNRESNLVAHSSLERPTLEEVLALQGTGWDGDLDEMRQSGPQLEAWLNGAED